MSAQKILLPILAGLSFAAAQTASICSQATATINSQADATQYASCSTITGDILVGPNAGGVISIDGPQQITGSLICENAGQLTSLGSSSLGSIGKQFLLNHLTLISTLSFTDLQTVGSISWTALPALPQLTFPATVTEASSVLITNTFLSTLDGINLATVGTLNINNNNRLKTFSTQVANITESLNIDSNGKLLDLSFPNLVWAANMTLRNVSSVSIPSLAAVNGSLGFYENYFTAVFAPNLTSVGNTATNVGSLAFVANPSLTNISMPLLQIIGGANQIANNSALTAIDMSSLTTIGGSLDFSGNFSTLAMGKITNVKGTFNMQSTADIDCTSFNSLKGSGAIQGQEVCKSSASDAAPLASGTSTATGSKSTSSKGAANSFGINEAVAGLSVVGGLLQILV